MHVEDVASFRLVVSTRLQMHINLVSYLDPGSGGPENQFTNRNATFMSWNLIHLARMLKTAGGIPAHGNQLTAWEKGERFGWENPEYRR